MNDTLLAEVVEAYGLGTVDSVERVALGYLSENYTLQVGSERYFLKQYRYDDEAKIGQIHAAKRWLAAGGIPVILPLAGRDGRTYRSLGGRWWALFPFVVGRPMTYGQLTPVLTASMGTMLGRIHRLSAAGAPPIVDTRAWQWDSAVTLGKVEGLMALVQAVERPTAFDELAVEVLAMRRRLVVGHPATAADFSLGGGHLTHGDFQETNVFFGPDDEVTWVYDLEKATVMPRLLELVRAMDLTSFNGQYEEENFARGRALVQAYAAVYPVDGAELRRAVAAYIIMLSHATWVEEAHYLQGNERTDKFLGLQAASLRQFEARGAGLLDEITSWV